MSLAEKNQLVKNLRETSIDLLEDTIYGTKTKKGIARTIKRALINRILVGLFVIGISVVANLGLFDGIVQTFDLTTLVGTLVLDATGILIKLDDLKEAFGEMRKSSNTLARSIRILNGQLIIIPGLNDPIFTCALQHYQKLLRCLQPLFQYDLDDKDIVKNIKEIVNKCAKKAALNAEDKDYCTKVANL